MTKASEITGVHAQSAGRDFAIVQTAHAFDLYEIKDDEAIPHGTSISWDSIWVMIEDITSGRSAERFRRFHEATQTIIDDVSPVVSQTMTSAGYEPAHTGGGCMAWRRDLADGTHVLVTNDDKLDGDPVEPSWIVGRYGVEDGFVAIIDLNLADAVRLAGELPEPESDVCYDSEAAFDRSRGVAAGI